MLKNKRFEKQKKNNNIFDIIDLVQQTNRLINHRLLL